MDGQQRNSYPDPEETGQNNPYFFQQQTERVPDAASQGQESLPNTAYPVTGVLSAPAQFNPHDQTQESAPFQTLPQANMGSSFDIGNQPGHGCYYGPVYGAPVDQYGQYVPPQPLQQQFHPYAGQGQQAQGGRAVQSDQFDQTVTPALPAAVTQRTQQMQLPPGAVYASVGTGTQGQPPIQQQQYAFNGPGTQGYQPNQQQQNIQNPPVGPAAQGYQPNQVQQNIHYPIQGSQQQQGVDQPLQAPALPSYLDTNQNGVTLLQADATPHVNPQGLASHLLLANDIITPPGEVPWYQRQGYWRAPAGSAEEGFTSYVPEQAYASAGNLPWRFGFLSHEDDVTVQKPKKGRSAANVPFLMVNGQKVVGEDGEPLRDLPILPRHISRKVEGWRIWMWQLYDPRVDIKDIQSRQPRASQGRGIIGVSGLNKRAQDFREKYGGFSRNKRVIVPQGSDWIPATQAECTIADRLDPLSNRQPQTPQNPQLRANREQTRNQIFLNTVWNFATHTDDFGRESICGITQPGSEVPSMYHRLPVIYDTAATRALNAIRKRDQLERKATRDNIPGGWKKWGARNAQIAWGKDTHAGPGPSQQPSTASSQPPSTAQTTVLGSQPDAGVNAGGALDPDAHQPGSKAQGSREGGSKFPRHNLDTLDAPSVAANRHLGPETQRRNSFPASTRGGRGRRGRARRGRGSSARTSVATTPTSPSFLPDGRPFSPPGLAVDLARYGSAPTGMGAGYASAYPPVIDPNLEQQQAPAPGGTGANFPPPRARGHPLQQSLLPDRAPRITSSPFIITKDRTPRELIDSMRSYGGYGGLNSEDQRAARHIPEMVLTAHGVTRMALGIPSRSSLSPPVQPATPTWDDLAAENSGVDIEETRRRSLSPGETVVTYMNIRELVTRAVGKARHAVDRTLYNNRIWRLSHQPWLLGSSQNKARAFQTAVVLTVVLRHMSPQFAQGLPAFESGDEDTIDQYQHFEARDNLRWSVAHLADNLWAQAFGDTQWPRISSPKSLAALPAVPPVDPQAQQQQQAAQQQQTAEEQQSQPPSAANSYDDLFDGPLSSSPSRGPLQVQPQPSPTAPADAAQQRPAYHQQQPPPHLSYQSTIQPPFNPPRAPVQPYHPYDPDAPEPRVPIPAASFSKSSSQSLSMRGGPPSQQQQQQQQQQEDT